MSLLPRYLKTSDNVTGTDKFWAWPLNALGRYVSTLMANIKLANTDDPVLLSALPEDAEDATELTVGGLQEVTDQNLETTDYLLTGGYAMREWPSGQGDIVGVVVVRTRNLPFYNQGTIQAGRGEVITLPELAQLLALYPVTSAPTVAFQILSHQVELPNLLYVDMEQVANEDAGYWDVLLYICCSVDVVWTSHFNGGADRVTTLSPSGDFGSTAYGMSYTRKDGYTRCPVGSTMHIELRYPGQTAKIFEFDWVVGEDAFDRTPIQTPLLDNLRTRLTIRRTMTPAGGSPLNETVYFLRDPGQTCSQDDAVFNALSQGQKLAQSSTVEPLPKPAQHWQARDCDGGSGPTTYSLSDDPMIEGGDDGTGTTNDTP